MDETLKKQNAKTLKKYSEYYYWRKRIMGTNFYIKKNKIHIGKRSAAGWYCWDCNVTLCAGKVHEGKSKWHNACPICKTPIPKKEDLITSGAVARELGFDKSPFAPKKGVDTCSSFSWAIDPDRYVYMELLKKRGKPIVDEYGTQYSVKEWLQLLTECPLRFTHSIGIVFS